MRVFSIYDSKGEFYSNPFYMKSKGEAMRAFADLANDKSNTVGNHPEDFTLFELGTFSERQGQFVLLPTPVSLGVAIEHVRSAS